MAASTFFTPNPCITPTVSLSKSPLYIPKLSTPRTRALKTRVSNQQTLPTLSDPYVLQIAEILEDSLSSSTSNSPPLPLQKLRDASSESLLSTPWPSRKDEPFRFTDTSFIRNSRIQPIPNPPRDFDSLSISTDTQFPNLAIVDGFVVNSQSRLPELPEGVFVGALSSLESEAIMKRVFEYVPKFEGDLFWSLNGVGAPDLVVVYVPEGCKVETPLHLRFFSVESSDIGSKELPVSNPRVLVLVEKGGEIGIIEEYSGGDGDRCYWANSVMEVVVEEGAKVSHSYIQNQSLNAAHIKWTSVLQVNSSTLFSLFYVGL